MAQTYGHIQRSTDNLCLCSVIIFLQLLLFEVIVDKHMIHLKTLKQLPLNRQCNVINLQKKKKLK